MLFTQLFFWAFFSLVLTGYSFVYKKNKLRTGYLLVVSLFFYFKTSGVFVLLLLFTICSDYFWGRRIYRSNSVTGRKLFLAVSVILNLSVLCYFKYAYFFSESWSQISGGQLSYFNHFAHFSNTFFSTHFSVDKLLLPIGVSFFTFQSLSYTFDIYRNKIEPVKTCSIMVFLCVFFLTWLPDQL